MLRVNTKGTTCTVQHVVGISIQVWLGVLLRTPPRTASLDTVRLEREPNHTVNEKRKRTNCPYAVPPQKVGREMGRCGVACAVVQTSLQQAPSPGTPTEREQAHESAYVNIKGRVGVTASASAVHPEVTTPTATVSPHPTNIKLNMSGATKLGGPGPPPCARARRVGYPPAKPTAGRPQRRGPRGMV